MAAEITLALLRHAMTAGGVAAAAGGGSDAETIAGAIITLAGFGWSCWRKLQRGK